jgi:hypothetical protein
MTVRENRDIDSKGDSIMQIKFSDDAQEPDAYATVLDRLQGVAVSVDGQQSIGARGIVHDTIDRDGTVYVELDVSDEQDGSQLVTVDLASPGLVVTYL